MTRRASLLLCLLLPALALSACAEDEEETAWTVNVTSSMPSFPADGSTGGTLVVQVLGSNGNPPPGTGDIVPVQCQDGNGSPAAIIGSESEPGRGTVTLNMQGIGQTPIRCSGKRDAAYEVRCLAVYKGATGVMMPLNCR